MKRQTIFYLVGSVERVSNRRGRLVVRWCDGYSRRVDGGEQPWRTKREVQAEARNENFRAVFVDNHKRGKS